MRGVTLLIALVAACSGSALADSIMLNNAHILTAGPDREIAGVSLLIEDGKITAIGPRLAVPPGAVELDVSGKILTPGLIAARTTLGAVEINDRADASDIDSGSPVLSAGVDVAYALNSNSTLLPVARNGGIGRAVVTPGLTASTGDSVRFGGQAALISTSADGNILARPRVAVTLNLLGSEMSRGSVFPTLKAMLADAAAYARDPASARADSYKAAKWTALDLDALVPVMRGEIPLIVAVDRASDISALHQILADYEVRLVIQGAAEAWLVADELASAGVSVILDPAENLPRNFDAVFASSHNALRLHEAGVEFAIVGPASGHDVELVRHHAGIAVAYGLPADAALRAVTSAPARIMGMAGYGEIAIGNVADIAIWSGDPFEPLTDLETLIISGKVQPLATRQQALGRKYRCCVARNDARQAMTDARYADPDSVGTVEAVSFLGEPLHRPSSGADVKAAADIAAGRLISGAHLEEGDYIEIGNGLAAAGRYLDAIGAFGRGLEIHPQSYRLRRHRAHRYLTTRQLQAAGDDLEVAVDALNRSRLPAAVEFKGTEPHGTYEHWIWYHTGIYHYLNQDFDAAAAAFQRCLDTAGDNDMLLGTVDWLYSSLLRAGHRQRAKAILDLVDPELDADRSYPYFKRVMIFKGQLQPEDAIDLSAPQAWTARDATVAYAIANMKLADGETEAARAILEAILATPFWQIWAYITAERDMAMMSRLP